MTNKGINPEATPGNPKQPRVTQATLSNPEQPRATIGVKSQSSMLQISQCPACITALLVIEQREINGFR